MPWYEADRACPILFHPDDGTIHMAANLTSQPQQIQVLRFLNEQESVWLDGYRFHLGCNGNDRISWEWDTPKCFYTVYFKSNKYIHDIKLLTLVFKFKYFNIPGTLRNVYINNNHICIFVLLKKYFDWRMRNWCKSYGLVYWYICLINFTLCIRIYLPFLCTRQNENLRIYHYPTHFHYSRAEIYMYIG